MSEDRATPAPGRTRPKPSEIDIGLRQALPFVGTFRKCEAEIAAGAYVAACVERGDVWQPIGPRKFGETLVRLEGEGVSWAAFALRFRKFDVDKLVEMGVFTKDAEEGRSFSVEPTESFFAAVGKWVMQP